MSDCKKCSKCGESKPLSEFGKKKRAKDGLYPSCKSCVRSYYLENKERVRERGKKYREENSDKIKQRKRKYRENNKEKIDQKNKEWVKKNRERVRQNKRKWEENNPEKVKESKAKYRKNNRKKCQEAVNKWRRRKYAESIDYRLTCTIRRYCSHITKLMKQKKELRSIEYLGCTIEELKAHLESQWQEGMSWDNHGLHGWHIDHIKPLDWYIKNSDDPWQANHYTNLQPLWAEENHSKNNKIN